MNHHVHHHNYETTYTIIVYIKSIEANKIFVYTILNEIDSSMKNAHSI